MRITSQQHEAIIKTIREFIPDGKVILFGSRADDTRRGGDIDLFVETSAKPVLESRLLLQYRLSSVCDDTHVDLIVKDVKDEWQPIHEIARRGVVL